jgi:hypothetical protein
MRMYVPKINRPSTFYGKRTRIMKAKLMASRPPSELRVEDFLKQLRIPSSPQHDFRFPNRLRFVDFYIGSLNLVIEVDGMSHKKGAQREIDVECDALFLEQHHIVVWRLQNNAAMTMTIDEFELAFWRAAEDAIGSYIANTWRRRWATGKIFKRPNRKVIQRILKEDWGNQKLKVI